MMMKTRVRSVPNGSDKEGGRTILNSKLSTWSSMSKVGSLLCQDIGLPARLVFKKSNEHEQGGNIR